MIKNILNLTKIFISTFYENLEMIYSKNKKTKLSWLAIFIIISIMYISYAVIKNLKEMGLQYVFLEGYFLIISGIIIFQAIMTLANVFYFAKDLEYVLPFPAKKYELLISKFNTLLIIIYLFEFLIGFIPIVMFGIMTSVNILFFVYAILFLILNPICLTAIVSAFMMVIIRVFKFVKNKEVFQVFTTFILIIVLILAETLILKTNLSSADSLEQEIKTATDVSNNLAEINKYIIVINPSVKALNNVADLSSILQVLKILIYDVIAFMFFVLIGNKIYLKDALRYLSNANLKSTKVMKKLEKVNIKTRQKAYIQKEFKAIFKNPMFFMQCIYPVLITLIIVGIISYNFAPIVQTGMNTPEFIEDFGGIKVDLEFTCIVLGAMQILFSLSNMSVTAISREGKNAKFIKYIPISLYKQFVYKNMPQVLLNIIVSCVLIFFVNYIFGFFGVLDIVQILIISFLLNIINSYLMVIADLKRPNLDWDSEYMVVKQNKNKLFQYILTICICLFLIYVQSVLEGLNLNVSLLILGVMFAVILLLIDRYVRKNENKLFDKIV